MYHKPAPFTSCDNINMCLCILLLCCPPLVDDCVGNSASEMVITPEEEDHRKNLCIVSKASNHPIDHVDKNPVPSHSIMHD